MDLICNKYLFVNIPVSRGPRTWQASSVFCFSPRIRSAFAAPKADVVIDSYFMTSEQCVGLQTIIDFRKHGARIDEIAMDLEMLAAGAKGGLKRRLRVTRKLLRRCKIM